MVFLVEMLFFAVLVFLLRNEVYVSVVFREEYFRCLSDVVVFIMNSNRKVFLEIKFGFFLVGLSVL